MHLVFSTEYRNLSRTPVLSFLFVTPIWCIYEFFTFRLNNDWNGNLRTGLDFLIRNGLESVNLPVWILAALVASFLIFYFFKKKAGSGKTQNLCFLPTCSWKA